MTKKNRREQESETKSSDSSPYIWQRSKIDYTLTIRTRPDLTEHQKEVIDLILDKRNKIIFISGPAGVSKSFLSLYCGLQLLNDRKVGKILYSRPMLESADSGSKLGMLPGTYENKVEPYANAMTALLEELLPTADIKKLTADERLQVLPVNYVRGLTFANQFCIFDECASFTSGELKTLLTRIGSFSKVVLCCDPGQSDLPFNKQGGFDKLIKLFSGEESAEMGIKTAFFDESEVVRSPICKFMVGKFKELDAADKETSKSNGHKNGSAPLILDSSIREWAPSNNSYS